MGSEDYRALRMRVAWFLAGRRRATASVERVRNGLAQLGGAFGLESVLGVRNGVHALPKAFQGLGDALSDRRPANAHTLLSFRAFPRFPGTTFEPFPEKIRHMRASLTHRRALPSSLKVRPFEGKTLQVSQKAWDLWEGQKGNAELAFRARADLLSGSFSIDGVRVPRMVLPQPGDLSVVRVRLWDPKSGAARTVDLPIDSFKDAAIEFRRSGDVVALIARFEGLATTPSPP
jgi:hypothetical protein